MKKKYLPKSFNSSFGQPATLSDDVVQFLKLQEMFPTMFDDKTNDVIENCDRWCKKEILNNINAKPWPKDSKYPFKEYTRVDELLRKHGKEFIQELYRKCPIKGRKLYNIYDSTAIAIFNARLDPWSLIGKPTQDNKSLWDKISEEGHV